MSREGAIENCRTAALGGHVAACTKCGHQHIAYNSCRNRHCPSCWKHACGVTVPRRCGAGLDAGPHGRPVAGRILPRGLHFTAGNRRHCPSKQGIIRDASDHRSRPKIPRRKDRHNERTTHMGLGDDAPSPCPRCCAGRRLVIRRSALGRLPQRVPRLGESPVTVIPPPVPRRVAGCTRRASWRSLAACQSWSTPTPLLQILRRCAKPTGSFMPNNPSAGRKRYWPT